jgi:hypothetical protein
MKEPPRQIQEWIHELEEGGGRIWLQRAVILLLTVGLAGFYHLERPRNFVAAEAMDMAQLGRNIAEGRGYTTFNISPLSLGLQQRVLKKEKKTPFNLLREGHPDITNPPVYPLMIAAVDKLLPARIRWGAESSPASRPPPEVAIGVLNLLWFAAAALLIYWMARKLFSSGAAFLAAAVFLCTDLFWEFVFSGLPTLWLCSLTLLVAGLVLDLPEKIQGTPSLGRMGALGYGLAIGAAVALGCLTVYSYGWILLPALFTIYHSNSRRRAIIMGACLAGFLLLTVPWLARTAIKSGMPFGTATVAAFCDTKGFPGDRLERSLDPDLGSVQIYEIVSKFAGNLGDVLINELPAVGANWFVAFFFVGVFFPASDDKAARAKWLAIEMIVIFLFVQPIIRTRLTTLSPVLNTENLLVLLAPFLFVIGAGVVDGLWRRFEAPFAGADFVSKVFVVVLCSAPLVQTVLKRGSSPVAAPFYLPKVVRQLTGYVPRNALMMSDIPWAVAWYGGRECVDLTLRVKEDYKEDFFVINDYQRSIRALYLSPLTATRRWQSEMIGSADGVWGRFYMDFFLRRRVPDGFPLRFAFDDDPVNLNYPRAGHLLMADAQYW